MKFARLTAASAHHLIRVAGDCISPVDRTALASFPSACTPYLYDDHVHRSCTLILYVVQVCLLPMMTCTQYSCQVTSSKTAGTPVKLTKGAVVDRALQLADAVGLDALTIRRLATELGVTP